MGVKIGLKDLFLAGLSAILLILSFPEFDLGILSWVGLVPLLVAIEGKGLKEAFLLCHVTGILFFTGIIYWIWYVSAYNLIDYTLSGVIYLPLYISLWGLGLSWIRKWTGLSAALCAPPIWVTLEYVRSHTGFLSFPWMLLGYSQYLHTSLIQVTSLTGVYGVSFLIVLMNAAIAEAALFYRGRFFGKIVPMSQFKISSFMPLIAAGLLVVAAFIQGSFVLANGIKGDQIKIGIVQGNIPQDQKWNIAYRQANFNRYASLSRKVAQQSPDLIIWPETSVPGDVQFDQSLQRKLAQVAFDTKSYLLVGSSEHAKFGDSEFLGKYYNSMFLISPEGRLEGQYKKRVLVPFGEYAPLKDFVKWPKGLIAGVGNYLSGDRYNVFSVDGATFGAVICWETIFPDLFREFVKRGAGFMVIATNEAWFGATAAPYQLLAMTTFRAAENRVAVARSANTGISAFIDPFGRIIDRVRGPHGKDVFVEGVLIGNVISSHEKTFYTQYGDLFACLQIAFFMLVLFLGLVRMKRFNFKNGK